MLAKELDHLPEGLLERPARRLHEVLDGPTLIHLPGRRSAPLFVSVLLHGNEFSGWDAVRELLLHYQGHTLPRALSLFIGNVEAARHGVRRVDGHADYNRVWAGGELPEHAMVRHVLARMQALGVFASIDVHNNTGLNPHYGCINRLDQQFLHLAVLFSRTVVYFIRPESVQSMAFSRICPSVTLECGRPGDPEGARHALEFIDAALHLTDFPSHPVPPHDYDLFHTVAIVKVPEFVGFEFMPGEGDLLFPADLDALNFQELPVGTTFARLTTPDAWLDVRDEQGNEVASHYFSLQDGELRTRVEVMPSMLTLDRQVIRQDCLCYLMERLPPLE